MFMWKYFFVKLSINKQEVIVYVEFFVKLCIIILLVNYQKGKQQKYTENVERSIENPLIRDLR